MAHLHLMESYKVLSRYLKALLDAQLHLFWIVTSFNDWTLALSNCGPEYFWKKCSQKCQSRGFFDYFILSIKCTKFKLSCDPSMSDVYWGNIVQLFSLFLFFYEFKGGPISVYKISHVHVDKYLLLNGFLSFLFVGKVFLHHNVTSKDNCVKEVFLSYLLISSTRKTYSANQHCYSSKTYCVNLMLLWEENRLISHWETERGKECSSLAMSVWLHVV